jgi:hypothetical protein
MLDRPLRHRESRGRERRDGRGEALLLLEHLMDLAKRSIFPAAVRAAADRHAANPLAEQPVTLLPTLYGALLQAITERNDR